MATAETDKRVPVFDFDKGDFATDPQGRIRTVKQQEAVEQIVLKAQQTARGAYLIYANPENPQLHHKYGSDLPDIMTRQELTENVRLSEMKRAIRESLVYDPWIRDVTDIVVARQGTDEATADFTVKSIFGNVQLQGVSLNG